MVLNMLAETSTTELSKEQKPKQEYLDSAKKIAFDVFENIKKRNYQEISEFMVESLGANWNESKKISQRNEYLSKFKIIGLKAPEGVYGDLNGYDSIDEGFLKGSDRLFRHTYITYHEGSFLIWEFRFYVDKNENLHYIGWSDKNPFG
jgi:hypothetical protein